MHSLCSIFIKLPLSWSTMFFHLFHLFHPILLRRGSDRTASWAGSWVILIFLTCSFFHHSSWVIQEVLQLRCLARENWVCSTYSIHIGSKVSQFILVAGFLTGYTSTSTPTYHKRSLTYPQNPQNWHYMVCSRSFTLVHSSVLKQTEKYIPCFPKTHSLQIKTHYSSTKFLSNFVEVFIEKNPYHCSRQLISGCKAWMHSKESEALCSITLSGCALPRMEMCHHM